MKELELPQEILAGSQTKFVLGGRGDLVEQVRGMLGSGADE